MSQEYEYKAKSQANLMAFIGNVIQGSKKNPNPYKPEDFIRGSKPKPLPTDDDWVAIEKTMRMMFPDTKKK